MTIAELVDWAKAQGLPGNTEIWCENDTQTGNRPTTEVEKVLDAWNGRIETYVVIK